MKATLGNVFFVGAPITYFKECDVGPITGAMGNTSANDAQFEAVNAPSGNVASSNAPSGAESFVPRKATVTDIRVAAARRLDRLSQRAS